MIAAKIPELLRVKLKADEGSTVTHLEMLNILQGLNSRDQRLEAYMAVQRR